VRTDDVERSGAPGRISAVCVALAIVWAIVGSANAAATNGAAPAAALGAADIVVKNVAARGGRDAWRKVETMVWTGHLESARMPAPSLPFELEQKRPNMTRFEIHAANQRTLRIFDGARGWKSSPGPGGPSDLAPYTPEETRFAREESAIDAPLIDLDSKGSQVALAGVEKLDGRKVYHLSVQLAAGGRMEVWVDAETFLDVQVARLTVGPQGAPRLVPTRYRDFAKVEGLVMPMTIQIGDGSLGTPDLMRIEQVAVNVPLSDRRFMPPGAVSRLSPARVRAAAPPSVSDGVPMGPPSAADSPPEPVPR